MTFICFSLKICQVHRHSRSPVLLPKPPQDTLSLLIYNANETPTLCNTLSVLVNPSFINHTGFRDLLPRKRDLFTSMHRFSDFHNSWLKCIKYPKLSFCSGLFASHVSIVVWFFFKYSMKLYILSKTLFLLYLKCFVCKKHFPLTSLWHLTSSILMQNKRGFHPHVSCRIQCLHVLCIFQKLRTFTEIKAAWLCLTQSWYKI